MHEGKHKVSRRGLAPSGSLPSSKTSYSIWGSSRHDVLGRKNPERTAMSEESSQGARAQPKKAMGTQEISRDMVIQAGRTSPSSF